MILDFHSHIYPPELARRVIDNMKTMQVPCYCHATPQALRKSMAIAGITHCVICNVAPKVGQSEKVISFAHETLLSGNDYAQCLIPFASIHPFEPEWKALLQRVAEIGFKGIKLHPDYQNFYIDDPRLEPFYNEISRLGLITVFHAGFDASMPDTVHASTRRIFNILPVLEKGTTILAHMGGCNLQRETLEYICERNVYLDTSYNLVDIDTALARQIFAKHTVEKIVFGTDSPWREQKQYLDYFVHIFAKGYLSENDIHKVLWQNGAKLLGIAEQF